ncbi:PIN/TRAM domain-containing protein [Deinococcus sp. VB343]|uniref:PIN domain-containing protein n=1 Tax=Deinococcus sp. VB142 TaxID=3112952 RepID=A0AAU6Q3B4_9DEIO
MLFLRLALMFVGLLLGYSGGQILADNGPEETATLNTVSLMLAGTLSALLLAPRAEKFAQRQAERFRQWYERLAPTTVAAATFGLIVALLLGVLLTNLLRGLPVYSWWLSVGLTIILAAFFVTYAVRNADAFGALAFPQVRRKPGGKILDSNVIIDGRIVALTKIGFLDGELIVPAFILRELQTLSDSSDSQKRTRGKRGLAVLEELREIRPLRIEDWDDPHLPTTDDKLIRLARETGAKLLTNDTNLAKIAKLHGLDILSMHEAAVALKPQLQAGDLLTITISKGGQQQGQGVGYLDDGTMVVVEEGLKMRGKPARVVVVNNVQTNVGRMVFAKLDKEQLPA